tara:strand:- start:23664 stop:23789 length:126 start_codon:yes stop_codon:yes gene_type:complete
VPAAHNHPNRLAIQKEHKKYLFLGIFSFSITRARQRCRMDR